MSWNNLNDDVKQIIFNYKQDLEMLCLSSFFTYVVKVLNKRKFKPSLDLIEIRGRYIHNCIYEDITGYSNKCFLDYLFDDFENKYGEYPKEDDLEFCCNLLYNHIDDYVMAQIQIEKASFPNCLLLVYEHRRQTII